MALGQHLKQNLEAIFGLGSKVHRIGKWCDGFEVYQNRPCLEWLPNQIESRVIAPRVVDTAAATRDPRCLG